MIYVTTELRAEFENRFPKGIYSPTGANEKLMAMTGLESVKIDDFENVDEEVLEFIQELINKPR